MCFSYSVLFMWANPVFKYIWDKAEACGMLGRFLWTALSFICFSPSWWQRIFCKEKEQLQMVPGALVIRGEGIWPCEKAGAVAARWLWVWFCLQETDVPRALLWFSKCLNHLAQKEWFLFSCSITAPSDGTEAAGGAPSPYPLWTDSWKLARKPHTERVITGLLPSAAGHTLPGRWAGTWELCFFQFQCEN